MLITTYYIMCFVSYVHIYFVSHNILFNLIFYHKNVIQDYSYLSRTKTMIGIIQVTRLKCYSYKLILLLVFILRFIQQSKCVCVCRNCLYMLVYRCIIFQTISADANPVGMRVQTPQVFQKKR